MKGKISGREFWCLKFRNSGDIFAKNKDKSLLLYDYFLICDFLVKLYKEGLQTSTALVNMTVLFFLK